MIGDDWPEELLNARVRIWFCPDRSEHGNEEGKPTVEWRDGVAYCLNPKCERKSTDTRPVS